MATMSPARGVSGDTAAPPVIYLSPGAIATATSGDSALVYIDSTDSTKRYVWNGTSMQQQVTRDLYSTQATALIPGLMSSPDKSKLDGFDSAAQMRDLAKMTGQLPSDNVTSAGVPLTTDLDEIKQLMSPSASAPVISSNPAFSSMTPAVNDVLTFLEGTTSLSHTNFYRVSRGMLKWLTGWLPAGSSYTVPASEAGFPLTLTQRAYDSATLSLFTQRRSAATSAVGSHPLPSGGSAVLSGATAAGSTLTWTISGVSNATSYSVQQTANDVPVGQPTAQSAALTGTFQSTTGQVGQALKVVVTPYNVDGVPGPTITSNGITVTGSAPTFQNTAIPDWPAHAYLDVSLQLVEGTWNLTPDSITHDFYRVVAGGTDVNYRSGNSGLTYTPKSAGDGLSVGSQIYYISKPVYLGVAQQSVKSTVKTVEAAPAALSIAPSVAQVTATQGQQIASVTLGVISGGTLPYVIPPTGSISPSIPATLALSIVNGNQLTLSGTPGSLLTSQNTTFLVKDSASTPASASMTIQVAVNPQGVNALPSLPYPVPLDIRPDADPGYSLGQTITDSNGIVRIASVQDPGNSGQTVYLHRCVRSEAVTAGGNNVNVQTRAEKVWINKGKYMFPTVDASGNSLGGDPGGYFFAFGFRPKSGEWPTVASLGDESFTLMQTHSESDGDTQPPFQVQMTVYASQLQFRSSYSAVQGGGSQQNFTDYATGLPAVDVWRKYAGWIKPGYSANANPGLQVYEQIGNGAWVRIVNVTHLIDYKWPTGSYWRIGLYCFDNVGWPSAQATRAAYFTTIWEASAAEGGSIAAAQASFGNL